MSTRSWMVGERAYVSRGEGVVAREVLVLRDDGGEGVRVSCGGEVFLVPRGWLREDRRGRTPPAYAERPLTAEEREARRASR